MIDQLRLSRIYIGLFRNWSVALQSTRSPTKAPGRRTQFPIPNPVRNLPMLRSIDFSVNPIILAFSIQRSSFLSVLNRSRFSGGPRVGPRAHGHRTAGPWSWDRHAPACDAPRQPSPVDITTSQEASVLELRPAASSHRIGLFMTKLILSMVGLER